MLDERELGQFINEHFRRRAFRLEVRDAYAVPSDGGDFARYLAGEPAPDLARKSAWLDTLRAERQAGKVRQWVHVVHGPALSDYLRFEMEWGYLPNLQAGAEVRILDLVEQTRPDGLVNEDFWLLDDQAALILHYDSAGRFTGAEQAADVDRYRRARDAAWDGAVPVADYWQDHPQYHRAA
ncbi:MAG: DUF6879 family protein [Streptosporangiaceae bacterium]